MGTLIALKASRVITPLMVIPNGVVLVEGERIAAVGSQDNVQIPEQAQVLDYSGHDVLPGFIDIHHHGAAGARAGEPGATLRIAEFLPTTGVTSWVPTIFSGGIAAVMDDYRQGTRGADILGIHIEIAYCAPKAVPGVPQLDDMLPPKPALDDLDGWVHDAGGLLKIMGFAPELPGALELISHCRSLGVIASAAHTKASYEEFMRGVEAGINHVTHVYQVMGHMHMRRPGVVGGALTCDQVTGELICDGIHNHMVPLEVMIRCKGADRIAVITDQTDLAGMPDGTYTSHGRRRVKKGMECREAGTTPDQDYTIAGSVATYSYGVYNLVRDLQRPLHIISRMTSLTPARIIGVGDRKGSLERGKDADMIVVDRDIDVKLAMVRGRIVHRRT